MLTDLCNRWLNKKSEVRISNINHISYSLIKLVICGTHKGMESRNAKRGAS